ncbi:stress-induced-phosphoprotein [Aureococcus anophagefferens]|uniref:Stress-induced-phosphoprotein n=1 Tax=Aureococcus anophagefferens TaxID=44056 RepID=A0ABR1FWM7_AURAN
MAAELKEGRELYKSGKFGDAAAKFGSALEDDSTEVDQLHMIHSNRCACYMQLKAFDKAYDDAEACTRPPGVREGAELDPANGAQHLNDAAKVKAKADAANGAGNYRRVPFPEQRSVQPGRAAAENAHLMAPRAVFVYSAIYLVSFTTDLATLRARYRSAVKFLCLSLVMHWGARRVAEDGPRAAPKSA